MFSQEETQQLREIINLYILYYFKVAVIESGVYTGMPPPHPKRILVWGFIIIISYNLQEFLWVVSSCGPPESSTPFTSSVKVVLLMPSGRNM